MNRYISHDRALERYVRDVVSNHFPIVNTSGVLHGPIIINGAAPAPSTIVEGDGSSGKELFIWGTTRWGSRSRVVAK